jgi:SlyX protein
MDDRETAERFAALETKMAYLEDFVARLQAEVVARNAAADRVAAEQAAIKEKLLAMAAELEEVPSRKPPHY